MRETLVKKEHLRILLCGILAIALLASIGLSVRVCAASEPTLTLSAEPLAEYAQDTLLELPVGTIAVGGSSARATASVKYPNGTVMEKQSVLLDRLGQYELFYTATVDGESYTFKRNFSVYGALYSVSGVRSSAEYVTGFGYGREGVSTGTVDGIKVSLASGDTFRFNQPIDVSNATALDKLLSLVITPETLGECDVGKFAVTLTDASDPYNYITVTAKVDPAAASVVTDKPANNQQRVYVTAGAQFQPQTGIEFNYTPPKLHASDVYGTIQDNFSLFGTLTNKRLGDNVFDLRLDYATRGIHISNPHYSADSRVSDLDDPYFYYEPWNGFTTGEVYVSIKAESYRKSTFNFVITKFIGADDLTATRADDTTKPVLTVDCGEYTEAPNAIVGKAYRIFPATAHDAVDGTLPVTVKVFKNYTGTKIQFPIADGCFIPAAPVEYTIEYTATDASGNRAVTAIPVTALADDGAPITLTVAADRTTQGDFGARIPVAAYAAEGGVSAPQVAVTAKCGDIEADVRDGYFIPLAEGNWTVAYTAIDYAGQTETKTYTVQVTKGNTAVFPDMPTLPKYLIAGVVNEVPALYAKNYVTADGAPVTTTLRYTDKDGEHTAADRRFTPYVAQSGDTVTVKYVATVNGKESSVSFAIPTLKIAKTENVENVSDYFVGLGSATVATVDGGAFVSAVGAGAGAEFANPLVAGAFKVGFAITATPEAAPLTVTLTDSVDSEIRVSFVLTDRGSSTDVLAPSGVVYHVYNATFYNGKTFEFGYTPLNQSMTLDAENNVSAAIAKTDSGKAFNGFPSGKVYLSFALKQDGRLGFTVSSIGNQSLASNRSDAGPQVYMGDTAPRLALGSVAEILPAYAGDVFDPAITYSMTVKAPNGTIVTDERGQTLQNVNPSLGYTIRLAETGSYSVQFTAEDAHGNKLPARGSGYVIGARDEVAPVLKVDAPRLAVTVGDRVYIPKATATDNVDGEVTVCVILTTAQGITVRIGEEYDGFTANTAGTYTLTYLAVDSAGNTSTVCFTIVAKGEEGR